MFEQIFNNIDDGFLQRTAWVGKDDGLLVIDLAVDGSAGADGKIDQSSELVFTNWSSNADSDLQALAEVFDTNQDGVLDANDDRFDEFKIWQDVNSNGISEDGELTSLSDAGIRAIKMVSDGNVILMADGSTSGGTIKIHKTDGSIIDGEDMGLSVQTVGTRYVRIYDGFLHNQNKFVLCQNFRYAILDNDTGALFERVA